MVKKSVLLTMGQVYYEDGSVYPKWTYLHVPNHYLVNLSKENERILFGASIHPYRSDWEAELDFCLENKAVLCKWISSSQMISPEHPKCEPIFKKLIDRNR